MNEADLIALIPDLRRYARLLTADAWTADDLVQDTLERACRKRHLWRLGSDLRAWLFTLMHNCHVDQVRGHARRPAAASPAADGAALAEAVPDAALSTELLIDLQNCLQQLPDEQRVTLLLVAVQDFSYRDAARITGVPLGTIMSRLSRARSRLQRLFAAGPAHLEPAAEAAPARVIPLHRS